VSDVLSWLPIVVAVVVVPWLILREVKRNVVRQQRQAQFLYANRIIPTTHTFAGFTFPNHDDEEYDDEDI